MGTIAGIARRAAPRAPMEVLNSAEITVERGVADDVRGRLKPGGRNRRQVTLMERADWEAAIAQIGVALPWQLRRANLLVEGLDLPQRAGARLRVGSALLEITGECDPCFRMDAIAPGLAAALTPDWRGGVLARVLDSGDVAVGDEIRIETP